MPDGLDGLVEYYRCIAGEHPDWDDYRAAMTRQNKSLLRVTIDHRGPIATGGFPPGDGCLTRGTAGAELVTTSITVGRSRGWGSGSGPVPCPPIVRRSEFWLPK